MAQPHDDRHHTYQVQSSAPAILSLPNSKRESSRPVCKSPKPFWGSPEKPRPESPVYMAYIMENQDPLARPPSVRLSQVYRPASQMKNAERYLRDSQGIYEHFHSPCNDRNKFLASVQEVDKYAYRDLPRMAPPPHHPAGSISSIRPASAPSQRSRSHSLTSTSSPIPPGARLIHNTTTQTGVPCFSVASTVSADLSEGVPLVSPELVTETWRVARVQTYAVGASPMGYGAGGKRPFHQDYRHYKMYGFAGRGAKTSWAYNPKMDMGMPKESSPQRSVSPARRSMGQPFSATPTPTKTQPLPPTEMVEPYKERVSLQTCELLSPSEARDKNRVDRVQVITYRQPVPSALNLAENPSPNHGSQSPFHQRYNHYRYYGFGGKGATSSWARNVKASLLD